MSYLKTMTTAQLKQNGFIITAENPDIAISSLYPNLSFRYRCDNCGNWSSAFNDQCPQCFRGNEPLKVTKQYYKFYVGCCADTGCLLREEAIRYLRSLGFPNECRDGYGPYIDLSQAIQRSEYEQTDLFLELNCISVSKYGARKLVHPGSNSKSRFPRR
ncbi:hypothetical protein HOV93_38710 [Planctomycetes bacterium FF15]|uniref:Uncharacterized protein n=1 Tax=Bremerella alba TaxID=980252 RepID=A0A7V8V8K4_9BACT|nr:hypothetical protein [Bremerella alba]